MCPETRKLETPSRMCTAFMSPKKFPFSGLVRDVDQDYSGPQNETEITAPQQIKTRAQIAQLCWWGMQHAAPSPKALALTLDQKWSLPRGISTKNIWQWSFLITTGQPLVVELITTEHFWLWWLQVARRASLPSIYFIAQQC